MSRRQALNHQLSQGEAAAGQIRERPPRGSLRLDLFRLNINRLTFGSAFTTSICTNTTTAAATIFALPNLPSLPGMQGKASIDGAGKQYRNDVPSEAERWLGSLKEPRGGFECDCGF